MGDVSIKMYDKFGCVLRIESTCNDIGTFRVKRKVEHRDGSSTEQKAPLKKSIYSLYQLFTIMKAANYRYLEFVSSFDDHSGGKKNLTKATEAVKEKGRSYRGLNFFSPKDLLVLEVISRGEYMTFGCSSDGFLLFLLYPFQNLLFSWKPWIPALPCQIVVYRRYPAVASFPSMPLHQSYSVDSPH